MFNGFEDKSKVEAKKEVFQAVISFHTLKMLHDWKSLLEDNFFAILNLLHEYLFGCVDNRNKEVFIPCLIDKTDDSEFSRNTGYPT